MDENTLQALTALAEKLGTTAEYLWGVLVRQAPIAAGIEAVSCLLQIAVLVFWTRFVYLKTKLKKDADSMSYCRGDAEWENEGAFFGWFSVVLLWLIVFCVVGSSVTTIVSGFFNPEYWALRQILK